jgi:hypothetical protein
MAWKELWAALIALLKFLHGNDSALIRKFDLFVLGTQAVNILNLFVTFGDTFLPSPQSYDDLCYEIIRMHHVYDNLHAMGNYSECLLHNFFILISKQYQTVHKSECDEVKETRHSAARDHERDGEDDDGSLL